MTVDVIIGYLSNGGDFVARDALGKLQEAKALDALADGLRKRDPAAAGQLDAAAKAKRRSAVKQLRRRPKPRTGIPRVLPR